MNNSIWLIRGVLLSNDKITIIHFLLKKWNWTNLSLIFGYFVNQNKCAFVQCNRINAYSLYQHFNLLKKN